MEKNVWWIIAGLVAVALAVFLFMSHRHNGWINKVHDEHVQHEKAVGLRHDAREDTVKKQDDVQEKQLKKHDEANEKSLKDHHVDHDHK